MCQSVGSALPRIRPCAGVCGRKWASAFMRHCKVAEEVPSIGRGVIQDRWRLLLLSSMLQARLRLITVDGSVEGDRLSRPGM